MDETTFWLALVTILCATGVLVYAIASGNRRAELRNNREDYRDDTMENLVGELVESCKSGNDALSATIDKLLVALTEPLGAPQQPVLVHEQEVAGQAQDAIREFHDNFTGDVTDTPDWTDGWLPDARGDEPRVASVRPGDSVIPGQGNWEQMMGEGRAIVGDEVVGGDEQWDGQEYDDGQ